jgi:hypothetical protein
MKWQLGQSLQGGKRRLQLHAVVCGVRIRTTEFLDTSILKTN